MYLNRLNVAEELNFLLPRLQDSTDRLRYISRSLANGKHTERAIFHRMEEISDDLNFVSRYLRNLAANQQDRNKYNPVKRSRIPPVGDIPSRIQIAGRSYHQL